MKKEKINLRGQKVLVVGLGTTGVATVRFLLNQGASVQVSEKKSAAELDPKLKNELKIWQEKGVKIETGGHRLSTFLGVNLIIPSPGVPLLPEIRLAQEKGVKVMAEVELAASFIQGKIIGITGTNGKSTTTTLVHKILRAGRYRSHLAGNIGFPLIRFAEKSQPNDIYVTEISSFQSFWCHSFRPDVAVLLNFSANHLDWHGSLEAYWEAKKKLFTNLTNKDIAILNRDDAKVWSLQEEINASVLGFSQKHQVKRGAFLTRDWVVLQPGQIEAVPLRSIQLRGRHNLDNVMAALVIGHLFQVPLPQMKKVISQFSGLEHRLEKVLSLKKVTFYNDSKATTVEATVKALQSFPPGIVLIMGGRDKGANFNLLRPMMKKKVRQLILLGEAKEKIREALEGTVPLEMVFNMREAVEKAFAAAEPGDIVLLSPACTSFDMFQNFEHRGRVFKREVRLLARRQKGDKIP